jgi:hypothetical protein
MKYLLLTAVSCLLLTGCYTMMYPPPAEIIYVRGTDSTAGLPDSLVGKNITIVNQNQVIIGGYYSDPFYYRGDMFGGLGGLGGFGGNGCWDPYYYNPHGYGRHYYWNHGRWFQPGYSPEPVSPTPKTPRRGKEYRRSDAGFGNPSNLADAAGDSYVWPATLPVAVEQTPPTQADDKQPAVKPDNTRSLRSVATPAPDKPADPPAAQNDDAKTRRGDTRGR